MMDKTKGKNHGGFNEILKNRNFFFLWFGQIISQFGDRLNQLALIAFIYRRAPGSSWQMAKLFSFTVLPVFLIGPVAGVYIDRWDRRRTMYISDFLRGVLILIIPLFLFYLKPLLPIYLVIFLAFCVGRFFVPAKLSIIPDLVDDEQLLLANSLVNTTGMIAAIFGFGLGGLLIDWLGAQGGFYLDSVSFFISSLFILSISIKEKVSLEKESISKIGKEIVEVIRKSVISEIREGIAYIIRQKEIRFIAAILFILWSALGSLYVVTIVFVQHILGSVTRDLGFLVMSLGLGLFLGSLAYGRFGQKISQYKIIFSCLILGGMVVVFFAVSLSFMPNFILAAVLALILGITISPIFTISNTLVHKASKDSMRGKVFSSLEIVVHLAFLAFMFISSILAEYIKHMWILVSVGILFIFIGIVSLLKNDKELSW